MELPINWPEEEHFKLRKSKFWVRHFFLTVIFKYMSDIPLLNNLSFFLLTYIMPSLQIQLIF